MYRNVGNERRLFLSNVALELVGPIENSEVERKEEELSVEDKNLADAVGDTRWAQELIGRQMLVGGGGERKLNDWILCVRSKCFGWA